MDQWFLVLGSAFLFLDIATRKVTHSIIFKEAMDLFSLSPSTLRVTMQKAAEQETLWWQSRN